MANIKTSEDEIILNGQIEQPQPHLHKSHYLKTDVIVTKFFGGIERGKSIQLGFNTESGYYHSVQLSNDEIQKLKDFLNQNF